MVVKILMLLVLLTLAVCLFFVYLSITAKVPQLGIEDGSLSPCPDTPNCVSSEAEARKSQRVDALSYDVSPEQIFRQLKLTVTAMGGRITKVQAGYLRAEFTSRLFRFVDDVEFRLEEEASLIHIRSASRVGHSDLGVNRKRVEQIRQRLQGLQNGRAEIIPPADFPE